mmetsp:Transcript_75819/g.226038  ORF Transcript_75819/g.226038 Transcript_75819/m.226038 type:complete len:282 (+) Transcript_75819:68-913(+)
MDFFSDFGSGDTTPGAHWLPGMLAFVACGTLAFHVIGFRWWRRVIQRVYSQRPWWTYLKMYNGILCRDVQKEIQYLSIVGCHHILGGGLMACGAYLERPQVWVAGALVGTFDDVHDSICMLLPAWPFGGDGEKRDAKLVGLLLMHHVAAFTATIPAIATGLHMNPHVQAIGAWLLLAGGVSHWTLVLSRTCNRNVPDEARADALMWILGTLFYAYSRLYAFPEHVVALFHDEYSRLSPGMQYALIGFTVLLSAFNLLIFVDVLSNMLKRIRHVLRGIEKRP